MAALQRLHHPNVVKYLGALIEPPTHALVPTLTFTLTLALALTPRPTTAPAPNPYP